MSAEGDLLGEEILIADPPRIQHWPHPVYVEEEKKYFIAWTDTRDDGLPPDDPWYTTENMDIYGIWLDQDGKPVGEEVPLCTEEGNQSSSVVAYNPVMKRFMILWYDRNAPGDFAIISPDPTDPWSETPGNITGTLYGKQSFLTAQVVEQGTDTPV